MTPNKTDKNKSIVNIDHTPKDKNNTISHSQKYNTQINKESKNQSPDQQNINETNDSVTINDQIELSTNTEIASKNTNTTVNSKLINTLIINTEQPNTKTSKPNLIETKTLHKNPIDSEKTKSIKLTDRSNPNYQSTPPNTITHSIATKTPSPKILSSSKSVKPKGIALDTKQKIRSHRIDQKQKSSPAQ